jgi:hypothetical protein
MEVCGQLHDLAALLPGKEPPPMSGRGNEKFSFPGGKAARAWRAGHSPQISAEAKSAWSYTSIPPTRLHGVVRSWKHRDNLTFTCQKSNPSRPARSLVTIITELRRLTLNVKCP